MEPSIFSYLTLAPLAAGTAVAVQGAPKRVQSRSGFLAEKLRGHFPRARFSDVVSFVVYPTRFYDRRIHIEAIGEGNEPCPVLWDTPIGPFWGRHSDGESLRLIAREQMECVYNQGRVGVQEGDVVLDVGAHLGGFTRIALDRGAAKVVAFEPHPVTAECFRRTFADEIREGRVVLIEGAAWKEAGSLTFVGESHLFQTATEPDVEEGLTVEAVTIDETIASLGLSKVDFIKMDIEGAERHALTATRQAISANKPRLAICTYHLPDDPVEIPKVILETEPTYQQFLSWYENVTFFH